MNEVEETLRVINTQIGFYKRKIATLKKTRQEIEDKYGVTMEDG